MVVIGILIFVLIVMSLIYGYNNVLNIQVIVEVNDLSTPYHHLGISFFGEDDPNGFLVEKLIIGMVFVNVVIEFYKHNDKI